MAKQIKRSEIAEKDLYKEIRDSAKKTISKIDSLNKGLKQTAQTLKTDLNQPLEKTLQGLGKLETGVTKMNTAMANSIKLDKAKAEALKTQRQAEQEIYKIEQQRERAIQQKMNTQKKERMETERLAKAEQKRTKTLKDQGNAYKQLVIATRDQKNESKRLGAEMLKLEQSGKKNTKEYRRLATSFKQVTVSAQKGDKALKKLDGQVGDNFRNVGNYGKALGKLKGAFASLGLAMGGAMIIREVFGVIKDFDQASANLASVLGVTRDEMSSLTEQSKELGATTRFTASEVSELQLEFAKLGFTQKEILGMTDSVLDLAGATGSELGESATIVGATMRGFGLDVEETRRVTDVMSKSFSSSSLDMSKFATSMAAVAPVAKLAGFSIEETTAMIGTLTDRGIDASTAGTGLRNMFLKANKAGLTFNEALDSIQNSTDQTGTAMELFGTRGATLGVVLANNQDDVAKLTETLYDSAGATKVMADMQLNTLGGSLDLLSSAFQGYILDLDSANGIGAKLTAGVKFLADNLDTILSTIIMVGKAFLTYKAIVILSTQANKLYALSLTAMESQGGKAGKGLALVKSGVRGVGGAFKKLGAALKANIFGIIIVLLYKLYEAMNVVRTESEQMAEINEELQQIQTKGIENAEKEKEALDILVLAIKDTNAGSKERGVLLDKLNKKYGTNLKNIKDEKKFLLQLDQVQKEINKNIEDKLTLMQTEQEFSVYTSKITALEQEQLILRQKMQDTWGKNWFTEFLQGFGDYENTKSVLDDQFVANEKVIKQLKRAQKEKKDLLVDLIGKQTAIEVKTVFEDPDGDGDGDDDPNTTKRKKLNTELRRSVNLQDEINKRKKAELGYLNQINKSQNELTIKDIDALINKENELLNTRIRNNEAVDFTLLESLYEQQSKLGKEAIDDQLAFQIDAIDRSLDIRFKKEKDKLTEQRDKLLAQEGLYASEKTKIEENYQTELGVLAEARVYAVEQNAYIIGGIEAQASNKKILLANETAKKIKEIDDLKTIEIEQRYNRERKAFELSLLKSKDSNDEVQDQMADYDIKRLEEKIAEKKKIGLDAIDDEIELENLRRSKNAEIDQKIVDDFNEKVEERIAIVQALTDIFVTLADKRIAKIDEEINKHKQQYENFKTLAKNGNITAKESMAVEAKMIAEQTRLKEKEEKRKQRIQLASSVLQTYMTNSADPDVKNPLSKTITDTVLLTEFIKNLPAFADGTEDTGSNGFGVDGKGGFNAILHPNERVMTKDQNALVGQMSNEDLSKLAYNYQNGMIQNVGEGAMLIGGNWQSQMIVAKLDSLEKTIKNKPETNIAFEEIIGGVMAISRETKTGNSKTYNKYRVK